MVKIGALMALTCIALTACSSDNPAGGSGNLGTADCTTVVRYSGETYSQDGFSDEATAPLGDAELANCEDTGADARGSVFPQNPDIVSVSVFKGFDPADVLALRFDDQTGPLWRIMVNDQLSPNKSDAITDALENDGIDG